MTKEVCEAHLGERVCGEGQVVYYSGFCFCWPLADVLAQSKEDGSCLLMKEMMPRTADLATGGVPLQAEVWCLRRPGHDSHRAVQGHLGADARDSLPLRW
jgi:hypothetical protein